MVEQLAANRNGDDECTMRLRQRHLALFLEALHAGSGPPPGPGPTWQEISQRWDA